MTEAAVGTPDGGDTDSPEPVTTVTTPTADSIPATPEAVSPAAPADAPAEPPASTAEPVTPSALRTAYYGEPAWVDQVCPGVRQESRIPGRKTCLAPAGDLTRGAACWRSAATGSARITGFH